MYTYVCACYFLPTLPTDRPTDRRPLSPQLFKKIQVILYSFYKNIVLTFILFYYLFFTGFSGQSLFEDWVYSGYVVSICPFSHTPPFLGWLVGLFVIRFWDWVHSGCVRATNKQQKRSQPLDHHPLTTPFSIKKNKHTLDHHPMTTP